MIAAGIDECGRGALAGPVVAAAVIWDPAVVHPDIKDSKKLSPKKRRAMAEFIKTHALGYAVAFVDVDVIDTKNILQATFDAMHECVRQLPTAVSHLFVDGNRFRPYHDIPHTCVVQGDNLRVDIAAASILAKVARDAYMAELPQAAMYDFAKNNGYGTPQHIQAIRTHGYSDVHRKSFHLKKDIIC
jgi:ribonuclease HII